MAKEKKKELVQKNTLYTGRGDQGTTTLFDSNQTRISKSANIIEALGSLDELNAYLGVVKVYSELENLKVLIGKKNISYGNIINNIQQTLFIIQAEVAGSSMSVSRDNLKKMEILINSISVLLPPIRSFTVSGGSLLSAEFDFSRTLARRVERRIVQVEEEGARAFGRYTIPYMNRLSSVLYAMSRYTNHLLLVSEEHPTYNK